MEEKKQNEINLLDLMQMFFRGLKKCGVSLLNLLGNTLRLLYRHKTLTCIVLAIGIAFGYYSGRPANRVFHAEAMAILNGSVAQTVKEVSRQLENASQLSDFTSLSAKLDLPDSIARNIISIESFYVIDFLADGTPDKVDFSHRHSWTDTLNVRARNRLFFRVRTRDVSQLPVFEEAFLNHFNTNSQLLGAFNARKGNLVQEIQILNSELVRLDSLAEISYFEAFTNQQIVFRENALLVGEQRKQMLHREFAIVQDRKTWRELEFAHFTAPVVLPTGFIVSPQPEKGRIRYMATYFFIGLVVAISLSLFIEHRKRILNYLQTK